MTIDPDYWEPTGEFRAPKSGEYYYLRFFDRGRAIHRGEEFIQMAYFDHVEPRSIAQPKSVKRLGGVPKAPSWWKDVGDAIEEVDKSLDQEILLTLTREQVQVIGEWLFEQVVEELDDSELDLVVRLRRALKQ